MKLSRGFQILVLTIGIILLIAGISAILYTYWPLSDGTVQSVIPATLLAPP
jgi:hypothetical protein